MGQQVKGVLTSSTSAPIANQRVIAIHRASGLYLGDDTTNSLGEYNITWTTPIAASNSPLVHGLTGKEVYVIAIGTVSTTGNISDTILSLFPYAYYKFSPLLEDSSPNGNDIQTFFGTFTSINSKMGLELSDTHAVLDMVSYVDLPIPTTFAGSNFSFSTFVMPWLSWKERSTTLLEFYPADATDPNDITLQVVHTNSWGASRIDVTIPTNGTKIRYTSNAIVRSYNTEFIHHVCLVRVSDRLEVYVNGMLYISIPYTTFPGLNLGFSKARIGNDYYVGGAHGSATYSDRQSISDVAIWDRALTQTEIRSIYEQGSGRQDSIFSIASSTTSIQAQVFDAVVPGGAPDVNFSLLDSHITLNLACDTPNRVDLIPGYTGDPSEHIMSWTQDSGTPVTLNDTDTISAWYSKVDLDSIDVFTLVVDQGTSEEQSVIFTVLPGVQDTFIPIAYTTIPAPSMYIRTELGVNIVEIFKEPSINDPCAPTIDDISFKVYPYDITSPNKNIILQQLIGVSWVDISSEVTTAEPVTFTPVTEGEVYRAVVLYGVDGTTYTSEYTIPSNLIAKNYMLDKLFLAYQITSTPAPSIDVQI